MIVAQSASRLKSLSLKNDAKATWKAVHEITGSKNSHNNVAPEITASCLNNHYAEISNDKQYIAAVPKHTVTNVVPFVSEREVHIAMSKLQKTATGPDNVPYWAPTLGKEFLSDPIARLINISLETSYVPTQWKTAIIAPVAKVPNAKKPAEFRPISLTSILCRMTERIIIKKYIYPTVIGNATLQDQFAFRPIGSTTAAIIAIVATILKFF